MRERQNFYEQHQLILSLNILLCWLQQFFLSVMILIILLLNNHYNGLNENCAALLLFCEFKKVIIIPSHAIESRSREGREFPIFQVISSHKNSYYICWDRCSLRTYKWEKLFYWKHQRDLIDLSNFNNNIRVTFQKNQIFCWFIPLISCVWNINSICHPWKYFGCQINKFIKS